MQSPVMVIVEGAEYGSALAAYLKACCGFEVIEYQPEIERFVVFLDRVIFSAHTPRICILRAHITGIARGKITTAHYREFEEGVMLAGAKLVFAVSDTDSQNTGHLADGYAHSLLEKRTYRDGDQITILLDWLGVGDDASRRTKASGDNVKAAGSQLRPGLLIGRKTYRDNRAASSKPRNDGAAPISKRKGGSPKARGG